MADIVKPPGRPTSPAYSDQAARLAALRQAVTDAAQSLATGVGDDVAAFTCVVALDDALRDLSTLLSLVPDLVQIASPGLAISERLAVRRDEVERQRSDLKTQRAALDAAAELESALRQIDTERQQIADRIGELERKQQLAAQLPGLRATLRTLEETIDNSAAEAADRVTIGLMAAVRTLTELTEQQRSLVAGELSVLIDNVASATEQTAGQRKRQGELTAELARQLAEADEVRRESEHNLPALALHRRADQELADGLAAADLAPGGAPLDRVKEALADIAQRLTDVDDRLKPLLAAHARAYEEARQIRNW